MGNDQSFLFLSLLRINVALRLRACSFDLWFTLITTNKERDTQANARRQTEIYALLHNRGYNLPFSHFQKQYAKAGKQIEYDLLTRNNRDYTNPQQIARFLEILLEGSEIHSQFQTHPEMHDQLVMDITPAYAEQMLHLPPEISADIHEALAWIKSRGLKTGIISNTGKSPGSVIRKVLARQNLDVFDTYIFSDEVELLKPHPRIFQLFFEKLNLKPVETLHIGDSLPLDIAGASQVGMHYAWYLGQFHQNYLNKGTYLAEYQKYSPKFIFDSYKDLPKLIEAIDAQQSSFIRISDPLIREFLQIS